MQATLAEIVGENPERDKMICDAYIDGMQPREILAKFKLELVESRLWQIINNNAHYVNPKIAWPKAKRIREYQRLYEYAPDYNDTRDKVGILGEIRKEIEGEKAFIDQSQHLTQIVYIRKTPDDYDQRNPT